MRHNVSIARQLLPQVGGHQPVCSSAKSFEAKRVDRSHFTSNSQRKLVNKNIPCAYKALAALATRDCISTSTVESQVIVVASLYIATMHSLLLLCLL